MTARLVEPMVKFIVEPSRDSQKQIPYWLWGDRYEDSMEYSSWKNFFWEAHDGSDRGQHPSELPEWVFEMSMERATPPKCLS